MDDEADTYKLWRIRKTIMQVSPIINIIITITIIIKFLFIFLDSNYYLFII